MSDKTDSETELINKETISYKVSKINQVPIKNYEKEKETHSPKNKVVSPPSLGNDTYGNVGLVYRLAERYKIIQYIVRGSQRDVVYLGLPIAFSAN